jgi:hypothetical protein
MPASAAAALDTCDGKAMVPYALKCPALKTKKGSSVIDQSKLQRDSLMCIIDKLVKYPQVIEPIRTVLFSSDFQCPADVSSLADSTWKGSYSTIDKIGKGWLAKWLVSRNVKDGLTMKTLEALDKVDPDVIVMLFCFEVQLSPKCAFPPALTSALAACQVFSQRAHAVEPRIVGLMKSQDLNTGVVNWAQGGCYRMTFAEGRCKYILHVPSGKEQELEPHVVITPAFVLYDNWSDMEARVELAPSKYWLHTLFKDKPKFLEAMPKLQDKKGSKLLGELSATVIEEFEDKAVQEQAAATVKPDEIEGLHQNRQEVKKAITEKAQQTIASKRAARGEKRKISLTGLVGAPIVPPLGDAPAEGGQR